PAAWFTSEQTAYFLSRLTGNILLLGALFLTGRLVRDTSRAAEPLVVLPLVSAYAWSRAPDMQHASTELLAVFLIALALVLYCTGSRSRGRLWVAALAMGAAPWAKLQAAPMAGVLIAAAVAVETARGTSGRAFVVIVGAVAPTLLIAVGLTLTGLWPD